MAYKAIFDVEVSPTWAYALSTLHSDRAYVSAFRWKPMEYTGK
jgi:hypothetical protein